MALIAMMHGCVSKKAKWLSYSSGARPPMGQWAVKVRANSELQVIFCCFLLGTGQSGPLGDPFQEWSLANSHVPMGCHGKQKEEHQEGTKKWTEQPLRQRDLENITASNPAGTTRADGESSSVGNPATGEHEPICSDSQEPASGRIQSLPRLQAPDLILPQGICAHRSSQKREKPPSVLSSSK